MATSTPPTEKASLRSTEEALAKLMQRSADPLAKRSTSGMDFVEKTHKDTYDFIRPEQWNLSGRAVFITGASRGFGRSFALSYAKAGASFIAVAARSPLENVKRDVEEAAKSAGRPVPQVLAVRLDVTDKESVAAAVKQTENAFGRCDILVNNSGYLEFPNRITEMDPDEWWRTWTVNMLGTFQVTRAFLPLLLKTHDGLETIANVTSVTAHFKYEGGSAYQMSKLAIMRFCEHVSMEYEDQGILCFCLQPGSVKTEITQNTWPEFEGFYFHTLELGADTTIWLTAERREWLAGRYIDTQWDMEEFLSRKDKIVKEDQLKVRMSVGLD